MGITIIQETNDFGKTRAVMIDDTGEKALTPVFSHKTMVKDFMKWLDAEDPRALESNKLEEKADEFKRIYNPLTFRVEK